MCLLTSAVELLVVFIALEISSISTYILAGYRKQTGTRSRSRHQVFPAGLVRHGVSALRHRADLWRTGTTQIYEIARSAVHCPESVARSCSARPDAGRNSLQGLRSAVPYLDARCLRRRAVAGGGADVDRAQGRGIRVAAARGLRNVPDAAARLVAAALGRRRAVHDRRQPGRAAPAEREAHAGLLLDRPCRLSAGGLRRAWLQRHRRRQSSTPRPTRR